MYLIFLYIFSELGCCHQYLRNYLSLPSIYFFFHFCWISENKSALKMERLVVYSDFHMDFIFKFRKCLSKSVKTNGGLTQLLSAVFTFSKFNFCRDISRTLAISPSCWVSKIQKIAWVVAGRVDLDLWGFVAYWCGGYHFASILPFQLVNQRQQLM